MIASYISPADNSHGKKVLVAGATGHLGAHVIHELGVRGYWTRALSRDSNRAKELEADDVFVGDVTKPLTLKGACEGVDVVFSAAGASLSLERTKEKTSYREVDYAGNKNLLRAALASGVKRFVYVSVFNHQLPRNLEYVRAHEDFARELEESGIEYLIVRPTGFFNAFAEMLEMARRGIVPLIGAGESRVNPIHEADLARVCVDALESGEREVAVGGPQILTRREITLMAFSALGKEARVVSVPAGVFRLMLPLIRLYDRRLHALFDFFVAVNQRDVVAPPAGERRLEAFFREVAGRVQA